MTCDGTKGESYTFEQLARASAPAQQRLKGSHVLRAVLA
jgi:hypothetical protein